MDTIGLDLHKRESHLCIGHDDGTVEGRCIVTSRERTAVSLNSSLYFSIFRASDLGVTPPSLCASVHKTDASALGCLQRSLGGRVEIGTFGKQVDYRRITLHEEYFASLAVPCEAEECVADNER